MGERTSPPFWRRKLGKQLRGLREAARLSHAEACRLLDFSPPRLSRMENGETTPEQLVLKGMLDQYGVPASDWEPYLELARQARQRGWWQAYGLPAMGYVALEAEAGVVREFALAYVPGLLQTEAYIRAVLSQAPMRRSTKQFENDVRVRLIRQERLVADEHPLELEAILDEGVLSRPVGGRQVMRTQLEQLRELTELPTVTVRVVPTGVGAHVGMMSAFSLLSFPEAEDGDVAYVEHVAGSLQLEKDEQVRAGRLTLEQLRAVALDPDESVALIDRAARAM